MTFRNGGFSHSHPLPSPPPPPPPENQRTASCLLKNQFDKHELLNILEIPENANDCLVFWNDLRKILKL